MVILEVLRDLDYGGVQTYVTNLSAELVSRGHRVLLASDSGPLKPQAEAAGVRCLEVKTAGYLGLRRAERELVGIIRAERVEVVNAHHGSASAAAYLATRRTGTPFLVTAHGLRPAWQRRLTFYWPPKVLAISSACRDHLVGRLGLAPERVVESSIGVDLACFSPGPPGRILQSELALDEEATIVLHVSRLSQGKSRVGIALADAASSLVGAVPNLTVLIAGSGSAEREVRAAAGRANDKIGQECVRLVGARADIPELMRLATVVVGAGIVALEAMASGRLLVAAGKSGLVGPVTPDSFALARASHFGDHASSAPITPMALADAILTLLGDRERCRELTRWARRNAEEHFDLGKIAEQVEGVYFEMLDRGSHQEPV